MHRPYSRLSLLLFLLLSGLNSFSQQSLWGVTTEGGNFGTGAIFRTDADGSNLQVKKSFYSIRGRSPFGNSLHATGQGKLYGMTSSGGSYLKGVLFEYDAANDSIIILVDFDGSGKGASPYGSLVTAAVNNKLYGMTSAGGINNS